MGLLSCLLKKNIKVADRTAAEYLTDQGAPNNKSLLNFFAINALELSAPASPVLLEQNAPAIPSGWLQLSGHPKSIAPAANGIVRKRVPSPNDAEVLAYRLLSIDPHASKMVPKFIGMHQLEGEHFIELQDLLQGFHDPNVMDIKVGFRTFSENEVSNTTLREDLYKKMISVDPSAPTAEEHQRKAITKLRYMLFRENMSSSQEKGFRIEAMKMRGCSPVTDMKTVKSGVDIEETVAHFVNGRKSVIKDMIKRLKHMRTSIEKSEFFQRHQVVGSSIFIVYDDHKVGVWLIDFAKALPLPENVKIDHRTRWTPGNCEEGLLFGFDEVIRVLEDVLQSCQRAASNGRKSHRR
ncbi:inositol-trisphosphate 3-kinase homolog isoform X2 [Toxorhynchites rutilus septentrionalis]|uniref:inositol-trisphosphate 3-kinase homolog isoform X2 n=1 Tax=Toxorhynchites rutilus septentrionalis TaxID=329112 RepID=UPI00247864C9|nr:inositol-trisphosphate 3-kinase homolog isoform X2 [Toxorhynchites rutilus septentrionalis]